MAEQGGRIRVGIGGWTFEPWRGVFYPPGLPQKDELAYASRHLTAIEINGTYYGSQKPESLARWRDETPDGFVFSVKGSRFTTNRRVLAEAGRFDRALLRQRRPGAEGQARADHLAVPAHQEVRSGRLRGFSQAAAERARRPGACATSVEVRHDSFARAGVRRAAARPSGSPPCWPTATRFRRSRTSTAPFVYARLQRTSEAVETGTRRMI